MNECGEPGLIQYLDYEGNPIKEFTDPFTEEDLKKIYYYMALSRLADEKSANMVKQGRSFFYAMASGHEAAQVGSVMALEPQDWVFPYHRSVATVLARGLTPVEFFADVMGKASSLNKAKQMPNHFGKKKLKLVTPSSTVGNQITEAVGTAMGAKLRGAGEVSIVYFGEGAASEGDFHVGMNFAGVYKTPTIFFCENNQYAISVPVKLQVAAEAVSIEACGYEFPGLRVDGNDIFAVYLTTKKMVERARQGNGPALIEALTYRFGSHSSSDDATRYRPVGEVEEWHRRDPIKRLLGYMKYKGFYSDEWKSQSDEAVLNDVQMAINEVEKQPAPEPATIFEDLFAETPWHLKRQREELLNHLEKYPPRQH